METRDCRGITGLVVISLLCCLSLVETISAQEAETATVTNFEGFGDLANVISTDRTKANLSCESGDMVVKLQFADKFRGVIYADRDRNSPCKLYGDGSAFYVFQIPLQGCGTKERVTAEYRMFVNDIVVRFHPSLELEGDEVKTILCRYPPPVAPLPPVIIPPPLLPEPAVIAAGPRRLSEVELMLIICAVLFLGLLLLGIGLAFFCLKKRNIKIVKRRVLSSGPPSQITKLSGSTLGPLSIPFEGIRIPRATTIHSTSGSEAALLTSAGEQSDTITSDYPSESPSSLHSEMEEVETRNVQITSKHMSAFDNQSFIREDYVTENQTLVQNAAANHNRLSTIHEREDMVTSQSEEFQRIHAMVTQQQHEQPPPQPKFAAEPPVYARIRKRQMEQVRDENRTVTESSTQEYTHMTYPPPSIPDNDLKSMSEFSESQRIVRSESQEARSMSEFMEESHHMTQYENYTAVDETDGRTSRSMSEYTEPPPIMPVDNTVAKAAPTRHLLDDRYLTTLTEAHSQEDTSRRIRDHSETHVKEVVPPKWDVLIRTYPPLQDDGIETPSETETWDRYSVVSDRPRVLFESAEDTLTTMEVQGSSTEQRQTVVQKPMHPNWDVLIRVLEPAPPTTISGPESVDDVRSVLSEDDRDKWRSILTTDSTLRTLLTEARTTEEFELIRRDERYEKLFDPPKWDVIIRILGQPYDTYPPNDAHSDTMSVSDTASYTSERPAVRYRRKSEFDIRSRRGSLPPLYENDDPLRLPVDTRSSMTGDSVYSGGDDLNPSSRPRYHRPSLMRSTSEVIHSLDMIERDSLDGRSDDLVPPAVLQVSTGNKVLYERYPHTSPEGSPNSSPTTSRRNRHRFLERSSTEMTVNNQTRRTLSTSHTDQEEIHSLAETDVHDHWRR